MATPQRATGTASAATEQLTNQLELSCISKKYVKKATHTWTIQRFLDRMQTVGPFESETRVPQEDLLKSDPFFVPIKMAKGKERRLKFELELELNNEDSEFPYLAFYVRSLTFEPGFNMSFKCHVMHADEFAQQLHPSLLASSFRYFSSRHNTWGWDTAIKKSVLKDKSNTILKEGSLILVTELEVECHHNQNEAAVIPTKPVHGHLGKRLWDNRDKTGDVTLVCGGANFKAHKVVLMASSDVLEAMFYHEDTIESRTGIVNINDVSPSCLEEFLHYIYFNRLSQGTKPFEEVKDLLVAAEKYNAVDLKTLCEHKLTTMLNNSNVGSIAVIANIHNASYLREHIVHYVVNNYEELVNKSKDEWSILPNDIIKDALALLAT